MSPLTALDVRGLQRAIAAPRVSFFEPDSLMVEPGVPAAVREALAAKGHKIRVPPFPSLGDAHGLTIEYDREGRPVRFTGGTAEGLRVVQLDVVCIRDERAVGVLWFADTPDPFPIEQVDEVVERIYAR